MNHHFIVLDGPEGCGKSTQSRLLSAALEERGVKNLVVRDPGTTRIGEQIRTILLDPEHQELAMRCEMLLYMAARAQMMSQTIAPALEEGKVVICDRFVSSTLAYQLGGEGLGEDEIKAAAEIAVRGRWPDLVLILDIPPEAGFQRMQREKDRIEQRSAAYHQQVRLNYLAQAKHDPTCRVVCADQPIQVVHQNILSIVLDESK